MLLPTTVGYHVEVPFSISGARGILVFKLFGRDCA